MNLRQVADLAVARLGLPIPMAKLATIHAIAQALDCDDTAIVFAEALADWAATRELESQCLEVICPLLVAAPRPETIALVRKAIGRPSIASDALLSLVTGSRGEVATWVGCHSGPATRFPSLDEEEAQLRASTFIPPFFTHQFEKLESQSGRPFMRQWAFEYKMLADRYGCKGDGYLDYFLNSDRENVGQFVAHRSHLARSAFLRTLAFAVEHWGMPTAIAISFAETVFPAEPIFLRLPPQCAPEWAQTVQNNASIDVVDTPTFAKTLIQSIEANFKGRLMHCSLAVIDEPKFHAEFEVFAIARANEDVDASQVTRFYEYLLGEISPERDSLRAFVSPDLGIVDRELLGFIPLLLPLIGYGVGYLQSDFISRVPYVPLSCGSLPALTLLPMANEVVLRSEGKDIGSWNWWRWNWKPTHPRNQPAPTACFAWLSHEAIRKLVEYHGGNIEHVWRLTTWRRDADFGEWTEEKTEGCYTLASS